MRQDQEDDILEVLDENARDNLLRTTLFICMLQNDIAKIVHNLELCSEEANAIEALEKAEQIQA